MGEKIVLDELNTAVVAETPKVQKDYDDFRIEFTTLDRDPTTRTVVVSTKYNIEGIIGLVKSQFQKKCKIQVEKITNSEGDVVYTHAEFVKLKEELRIAVEKVTIRKLEEKRIAKNAIEIAKINGEV